MASVVRPSRPEFSSLIIQDLELQVRLGCLPEERALPQEVRIRVEFRFPQNPLGCESDDLKDTICYAQVSKTLEAVASEQEYRLIERLAQRAWDSLKLLTDVPFSISVHKVRPPVSGLRGGSHFRMGDFV